MKGERASLGGKLEEHCQGRTRTEQGNTLTSQSEPPNLLAHRLPNQGILDLSVLLVLSRANV